MKKILALVMAMTMAVGLTACGGSGTAVRRRTLPQRRAPLRKIRQKTLRLQRMRRLLPREILIR